MSLFYIDNIFTKYVQYHFDEFAVQFLDEEHLADEDRFIILGMSKNARLLMACHCERESGNVIRIISGRKATKNENKFHKGN